MDVKIISFKTDKLFSELPSIKKFISVSFSALLLFDSKHKEV